LNENEKRRILGSPKFDWMIGVEMVGC
jgi:hypothetical protein